MVDKWLIIEIPTLIVEGGIEFQAISFLSTLSFSGVSHFWDLFRLNNHDTVFF